MLTDAIKALDEAESLINMVETNTTVDPRHMSYRALQHLKQVREYLEKSGAQSELIGYYSKTGHGIYYRETLTPEIAELTHGGVSMWKPMFAGPVQQEPVGWRVRRSTPKPSYDVYWEYQPALEGALEAMYLHPILLQQSPVAYMRKWAFDGETPTKTRNENNRLVWEPKYKLLPVTVSPCLGDDIALVPMSPAPVQQEKHK